MTMTDDEMLAEFRAADALLEGHFILSSGLRSRRLPAMRPGANGSGARAERWRRALAEAPADVRERSMWSSRRRWAGSSSAMRWAARSAVRRCSSSARRASSASAAAFAIEPGERVLMVEDIVTTGLSSREAIAAVRRPAAR